MGYTFENIRVGAAVAASDADELNTLQEPETSSSYSELTMIFFRVCLIKIYFLYRIWFFFFIFLSLSLSRSLACSLFLHRIR